MYADQGFWNKKIRIFGDAASHLKVMFDSKFEDRFIMIYLYLIGFVLFKFFHKGF